MQNKRPSERELTKRLMAVQDYLQKPILFANPGKAVGELMELGIGDSQELGNLIKELAIDITPKDYCGGKPPQKSYEKAIFGNELLAFSWWSCKLNKQMYIKFVLKNERFYYVSLHKSRLTEQKDED